jgi:hypothetical protein
MAVMDAAEKKLVSEALDALRAVLEKLEADRNTPRELLTAISLLQMVLTRRP